LFSEHSIARERGAATRSKTLRKGIRACEQVSASPRASDRTEAGRILVQNSPCSANDSQIWRSTSNDDVADGPAGGLVSDFHCQRAASRMRFHALFGAGMRNHEIGRIAGNPVFVSFQSESLK
jgi:hypothetical protein